MAIGSHPTALAWAALVGAFAAAAAVASEQVTRSPSPAYEVYAVRYATAPGFAVSSLVAARLRELSRDSHTALWAGSRSIAPTAWSTADVAARRTCSGA